VTPAPVVALLLRDARDWQERKLIERAGQLWTEAANGPTGDRQRAPLRACVRVALGRVGAVLRVPLATAAEALEASVSGRKAG
jgi:hypothetical protein